MRSKLLALTFAAAAFALAGAPAQAGTLVNGGFDDGMNGLEGWTADSAWVQTPVQFNHRMWPDPGNPSTSYADYGYDPVDGWRFASISANLADTPVILSQSFTASAGAILTGSAAFLAEDAVFQGLYNDYGFVRISSGAWSYTLFSASVASVSSTPEAGFGYTPWTGFTLVLPSTAQYLIEAGVANADDDYNPSFLLVDAFSVTPEPGTWAMMLAGFFGAGLMIRRRRAVAA